MFLRPILTFITVMAVFLSFAPADVPAGAFELKKGAIDYFAIGNRHFSKRHGSTTEESLALAVEAYDMALKHNPHFADAYNNRGVAHFLLGDFEKAMADYQAALALDPDSSNIMSNMRIMQWEMRGR
ncbi:MAG: tetratricopeptide repeat protein [Thermodesulfobacteriota bacterium]